MRKTHLTAAATCAAILILTACGDPKVVTVNKYDPQAEALANAQPVTAPPPMMQASRAYRCRDNSLVYIDFYTNNTAQVRRTRGGEPTILTAQGGNPPYTAEGYSVSANAETISFTAPGKGTQSCHT
ncbi:MAG TPA: hypothetical protein VGX37_10945 [Allosphingosinicella sp.]|jgi:hypothetical protein|nr:hypothetical protein [Allosphingosinicella sp.]